MRDENGRVLGRHAGVHHFTIGQRKGLGISGVGIPLYVVDIDAANATVTVGARDALERVNFTASGVNWVSGEMPTSSVPAHVRIRYRHREAPAVIGSGCSVLSGRCGTRGRLDRLGAHLRLAHVLGQSF